VGVALQRVSEDIAGLVQDGNLVTFAQLASLVPSNEDVVDKCSVSRQVFEYSDNIAALLLSEQQTVPV